MVENGQSNEFITVVNVKSKVKQHYIFYHKISNSLSLTINKQTP